jgi:hypothetical protein
MTSTTKSSAGPAGSGSLEPRLTGGELNALRSGSDGCLGVFASDRYEVAGNGHKWNYSLLNNILSPRDAEAIEKLVKSEASWKLNEKYFLSKHDVVWAERSSARSRLTCTHSGLRALFTIGKKIIEESYNAFVGDRFEIKGTKMTVGQWVGIHNDSPDGNRGRTENFRLLYYPNSNYKDVDGGHLLLYSARDQSTIVDGIRPIFNSGVLMPLSEHSYHSVCKIREGVRYTVAVLYWGYPLLTDIPSEKVIVARCLKSMTEAGLEDVLFGTTTRAYHLYHTYRLLTEWNAPLSVRLAGLTQGSWGGARKYEDNEGRKATDRVNDPARLIRGDLELPQSGNNGDEIKSGAKLIQLAGLLEQTEDTEGLAKASSFLNKIDGIDDVQKYKIHMEIERLGAEIRSS